MSKLQDCVPPFPYIEAKAVIEAELGRPLSEIFRWIGNEPVAAGSLAQVYRARTWTDDEVAVKVQRPRAEAVINLDIRILCELAALAERHLSDLRQYEPTRIVDEFARTIRRELICEGGSEHRPVQAAFRPRQDRAYPQGLLGLHGSQGVDHGVH